MVVGRASTIPLEASSKQVGAWRYPFNGDNNDESTPDPNNEGMLAWSQRYLSGGQRDVFLRWYEFDPTITYEIFRSADGGPYTQVGQTTFSNNYDTMISIMGPGLTAILRHDLVAENGDTPLTPAELYDKLHNDPGLALNASERYSRTALATGMAYLDEDAPLGAELAYYIRPLNSADDLTHYPVCVPSSQPHIPPANLRESEIVAIPGDMGHGNSTRPISTSERFDFSSYRYVEQRHGQTFLVWDEDSPVLPPTNPQDCIDAPQLARVGYTAYRRGVVHGTTWQPISRHPVHYPTPILQRLQPIPQRHLRHRDR